MSGRQSTTAPNGTSNANGNPKPGTLPGSVSRHNDYYLPGGDLHLLLGGKIHFRIHSYFFTRESEHWKSRLSGLGAPAGDKPAPGAHESTAITLKESPEDFSWFLWVFYNPHHGVYDKANADNWSSILHIATEWGFEEVRKLAITQLSKIEMDTVKRIKLYQNYKVPQKYLFPLYMELASRPKMLGREEYLALDTDTLWHIGQAREMLRAKPSKAGGEAISPIRETISEAEVFDIVAETFGLAPGVRKELRPTLTATQSTGGGRPVVKPS